LKKAKSGTLENLHSNAYVKRYIRPFTGCFTSHLTSLKGLTKSINVVKLTINYNKFLESFPIENFLGKLFEKSQK
jgi:hypothetical protein